MKSLTTNSKKLTAASILLLLIPFLFFVSRFLQYSLHISVPPDTWLKKVSFNSIRIALFASTLILLPLIAVILNLLSLNQLRNAERQAQMDMAAAVRLTNFIIIIIAGSVALLFSIVMLVD
jgi:hypothetical protein